MTESAPEKFALARRGLPLAAGSRTTLRGTWLPSAARNPVPRHAEAVSPVLPPPDVPRVDESEPWWMEAAEWVPREQAAAPVVALDTPRMQAAASLKASSPGVPASAPAAVDTPAAGIAQPVRAVSAQETVRLHRAPEPSPFHEAAAPRQSPAGAAVQPTASDAAIRSQAALHEDATDAVPQPAGPTATSVANAPFSRIRPSRALQATRLPSNPGAQFVPLPAQAGRPAIPQLPRDAAATHSPSPTKGHPATDAAPVSASTSGAQAESASSAPPPHARESVAASNIPVRPADTTLAPAPSAPSTHRVQTMGEPQPSVAAVPSLARADMAALLAPAPAPARQVQIDRITVTVQPPAAMPKPAAPPVSAAAARAAAPAPAFRNPWSGYHARRD